MKCSSTYGGITMTSTCITRDQFVREIFPELSGPRGGGSILVVFPKGAVCESFLSDFGVLLNSLNPTQGRAWIKWGMGDLPHRHTPLARYTAGYQLIYSGNSRVRIYRVDPEDDDTFIESVQVSYHEFLSRLHMGYNDD